MTGASNPSTTLAGRVSAAPTRTWPLQAAGPGTRTTCAETTSSSMGRMRLVPTAFGRTAVPAGPPPPAQRTVAGAAQNSARGAAPAAARPAPVAFPASASRGAAIAAPAPAAFPALAAALPLAGRAAGQAIPARAAVVHRPVPSASVTGTGSPRLVPDSPVLGRRLSGGPGGLIQERPSRVEGGQLGLGARVEALFEGQWYAGVLAGLPEQDEEGLGRWAVRCDVDPEGIYAYVTDVRPAVGASAAVGAAAGPGAHNAGGATARGAPSARAAGAEEASAADVVVTKAFLADGNELFMVCDAHGNELGTFNSKLHLDFELSAGPEMLQRWLQGLTTPLLPGLLMLLVEATEQRGKQLREARERRDALHSPEDYFFFGLSPDCSDHDLERAYRRLCARLHPDKGGDEASFAAMRQRYERLKSLRARGGSPGAGAAAGGGGSAPEGGSAEGEGGSGGSITWDPSDRASMLQAHEDLRLQLIWIAEQTSKVERDIEELSRRQHMRYCLADGPAGAEAVGSAASPSAAEPVPAVGPISPPSGSAASYAAADGTNARHDIGRCMICLESIPADPRLVVNLCCAEPQCQCLLHLRCFLDPQQDMNDQLRRCMICKRPSDPELVRKAVQAREWSSA
uniref:J domain-containing protein n=1 Tax=Alexandrium monilatum TaxID=311494 RepID=A0A7S4Q1Q4_9DINO